MIIIKNISEEKYKIQRNDNEVAITIERYNRDLNSLILLLLNEITRLFLNAINT